MHSCSKCKEEGADKKHSELSSRISSMRWHAEDYDRMKGKGRFKKDHPDSHEMMEKMMDDKTKLLTNHMGHSIPAETSLEEKPRPITTGMYSG